MSVHQLKDGRWQVQHSKGKDPDRPNATKKYFGRGPSGEQAAIAFNSSLGLGTRTQRKSPQFVELANEYIGAKEHTLARSTYDDLLCRLPGTILPVIGRLQAHEITAPVLDRYVSTRAQTVKRTTIHRELSIIRAVLRWAMKRRLISSYPAEYFAFPRRDDARLQPPTKAEFEAILACASPHLQRAMLIAYHTGLRPGRQELLRLTWDSVDFGGKTLMVLSADKGGLPLRMVPLNATILEHLARWHAEDEKTSVRHLVHYKGKSIKQLQHPWEAAKKRAGITRRIRPYDIRHRCISDMLEAGADLRSVSEIVGHASPDMTMRVYQHLSSAQKRAAVDSLG